MTRFWRLAAACLFLILLVAGFYLVRIGETQKSGTLAPGPEPFWNRPKIAWGLYMPDVPGRIELAVDIGKKVGKKPAIVMWYHNWAGPYTAFSPEPYRKIASIGATAMLSWMSSDPTTTDPNVLATYTDRAVAEGRHDDYIRAYARGLQGLHQDVFLRFDFEMNGDWFPWCAGVQGNTAADFVAMWRHVHDIFKQEGASKVRWVWSPNIECPGSTPFTDLYPGDAYVDWVALDGYNYGFTGDSTNWSTFLEVYRASVSKLVTAFPHKPIMIAELGVVEGTPGSWESKEKWIADALQKMPLAFPEVQAFIWFNQNNGGGRDFRIESRRETLGAFSNALSDRIYDSTFRF